MPHGLSFKRNDGEPVERKRRPREIRWMPIAMLYDLQPMSKKSCGHLEGRNKHHSLPKIRLKFAEVGSMNQGHKGNR